MMKSVSAELIWPAIVDPRASVVFGFLNQIQQSQWLSLEKIHQAQAKQLAARLLHAKLYLPYFKALLKDAKIDESSAFEILNTLPVLTRSNIQDYFSDLSGYIPKSHGDVSENKTSGSTGEPVSVKCSAMAYQLRAANMIRGHFWQKVDFKKSFAAIRASVNDATGKPPKPMSSWGGFVSMLFESGASSALDISTPIEDQVAWLAHVKPSILMTYPSNLQALMDLIKTPWPELTQVLTISETLSDGLRTRVVSDWKVPVYDKYSSEEAGPIAIECAHGRYHCPEHLIVEVLDEEGHTCKPGEIGRIVITDLFNFAFGLIRYEIRDFAEAGSHCNCGRGLPVINRIVGRVRNLITLPNGKRFWPTFGLREYGELAAIKQMQFIQIAIDQLVVKFVADQDLKAAEKKMLTKRIQTYLDYPLDVTFERVSREVLLSKNGKFEEFRSLIN